MAISVPYYGALKTATWLLGLVGAVIVAMDPIVKVAIIVAIPPAITGLGTLVLGFLNRRDSQKIHAATADIKASVNGIFSRVSKEKAEQTVQLIEAKDELTDTKEQLSHAQGRREGVEATEDKKP